MQGDNWKAGFWNDDIPTEKHYEELERNAAIAAKDERAVSIAAYCCFGFVLALITLALAWIW